MMVQPNYNRYNQVGKDSNGNPTGSSDGMTGQSKGWRQVLFVPGNRGIQIPEFNEMQSILWNGIQELGDYVLTPGKTVGLQLAVNLNSTPKTATIQWIDPNKEGTVYALGMFHTVPEVTLNITGVGQETISVTITATTVTEVEDPTLKDPVGTYGNIGNGGAYRLVYTVTPVVKTAANASSLSGSYDLWVLQDGQIATSSADLLTSVDQNLINYTDGITGNCVLSSMRVRVQDQDDSTLLIPVDAGRAIVSGRMVGYDTTQPLTISKAKFDSKTTLGELIATSTTVSGSTPNLTMVYSPANSPIESVTKLNALTVIKKEGSKTSAPFSQNPSDPYEILISTDAPYGPLTGVISVYDVQAAGYINFTSTSGGFRVNSIPTGDIRVVWVYNATLSSGTDFEITSNVGDITKDKRSITLLRQYPAALDTAAVLNATYNDSAQLVYPGVGSTTVSSTSVSGQNLLNVGSTFGIVVGQQLYVGTTRNTGTDEAVTVAEIVSGSQLRLNANLANTHNSGDFVYYDPDYIGLTVASNTTELILDYTWMLDRIDIVYIDSDNNIKIQAGQSNHPAYAPPIPLGVLPLAQIQLKGNGNAADTTVVKYDNAVMQQSDLRALKQDVETLKYNLAIQNIQTSAYNEAIAQGLALRGVLTDALVNSDVIEVNKTPNAYYNATIDPDVSILAPKMTIETDVLSLDTTNSTCFVGARTVSLGHSMVGSSTVINLAVTDSEQLRASTNPPKPLVVIDQSHYLGPADRASTFKFLNTNSNLTETISSNLEGGNWKTRQTEPAWLQGLDIYLPARTLMITGRNFTPSTSNTKTTVTAIIQDGSTTFVAGNYTLSATAGTNPGTMKLIYNGGTPVDNVIPGSPSVVVHGGAAGQLTLTIGATLPTLPQTDTITTYKVLVDGSSVGPLNGVPDSSGTFMSIPVVIATDTVSGHDSRTLTIQDGSGNLLASTVYGVSPNQAQLLPIGHDSLAADLYPQVAQIYGYAADTYVRGANLYFSSTSTDANSWVEVQLRDTLTDGSPSANILGRMRLTQSQIVTTGPVTVNFPDPIFCAANTKYALCVVGSNGDYKLSKSVVGHSDTTGKLTNVNPIPNGSLYTSADGASWTIQSEAALTFQLLECSFQASKSAVVFQSLTPTLFSEIPFIIARAQQLVPRGCAIDWSYSLNGNITTIALPIDTDGTLNPQVLPQTATSLVLRANLRGTTQVSPLLGKSNTTLLSLNPATDLTYTTRVPTSLPDYTQLRVTLQLLTATSNGDLTVKMSDVDDVYGYGYINLSGVPVSGDQLTITVDSVVTNFAYAPGGTPSLADLASAVVTSLTTSLGSNYIVSLALNGSDQQISIRRTNIKAFVSGDITATATPHTGSTLAVASVVFNYQKMTLQSSETAVVDSSFTKYVYTITGLAPASPYTFRLKLETHTSNVLTYPQIRNITAVVSS